MMYGKGGVLTLQVTRSGGFSLGLKIIIRASRGCAQGAVDVT